VDFLRDYGLRSPYVLQPDIVHGNIVTGSTFVVCRLHESPACPWISPHVMRTPSPRSARAKENLQQLHWNNCKVNFDRDLASLRTMSGARRIRRYEHPQVLQTAWSIVTHQRQIRPRASVKFCRFDLPYFASFDAGLLNVLFPLIELEPFELASMSMSVALALDAHVRNRNSSWAGRISFARLPRDFRKNGQTGAELPRDLGRFDLRPRAPPPLRPRGRAPIFIRENSRDQRLARIARGCA
jgi:hypothetical protein